MAGKRQGLGETKKAPFLCDIPGAYKFFVEPRAMTGQGKPGGEIFLEIGAMPPKNRFFIFSSLPFLFGWGSAMTGLKNKGEQLMDEKVVIIDFGGQQALPLARKIRELQVYCEIMPPGVKFEDLVQANPSALVLLGEPVSVASSAAPRCDLRLYALGIPILAAGYGMQLMAKDLGKEVKESQSLYHGETTFILKGKDQLFKGCGGKLVARPYPGAQIITVPRGFKVLAEGKHIPVAAMADQVRNFYGLQVHPEIFYTPQGRLLLSNFLFEICRFAGKWTVENFMEDSIREIKDRVGRKGVVCGLSGGIDSSVAALLVHRAIGSQLTCLFVDNGLLRKGEKEQVLSLFEQFKMQIKVVEAAAEFLALLRGVIAPEEKRKIIGNHFIRVFEREALKLGEVDYLVQGTLYPDLIESGATGTAVIKSHHNVGGLPQDLGFELIEPLKYLFKDEVRKIAIALALPEEIVWRHPFPGPGLAVRILGEVTPEKVAILQEADAIIRAEIKKAGLYREIWQAFAVLPNILSVGVKDGCRVYAHTIVLRAVTSRDGMEADWFRFPYDLLERISTRLVNEIPLVNRFVYDMTTKPPATIEWE